MCVCDESKHFYKFAKRTEKGATSADNKYVCICKSGYKCDGSSESRVDPQETLCATNLIRLAYIQKVTNRLVYSNTCGCWSSSHKYVLNHEKTKCIKQCTYYKLVSYEADYIIQPECVYKTSCKYFYINDSYSANMY